MAAGNIIESLFVALGFQVDTAGLDVMRAKTAALSASALKVGALFAGAASGIGLLAQHVASSLGDINSFAELNQISARSVAALGKIAVEHDGSLEGMRETIQSLNRVTGEAALGIGRGAMTFKKLGLSAKFADGSVKSFDDILGDVADKMQGMSRQGQIALAAKLGLDPQFVRVLEKGRGALAKMREEAELLNPFTEQDYQLADQVDKLFIKARVTTGVLTKMVGVALLPVMKQVLETYLAWFKASRQATSDVLIRALRLMAGAIGTMWDWVLRLVRGLMGAYDWLSQFRVVTYAVIAALAVFAALKTYDAFVQISGAISALVMRMLALNAASLLIPALIGGIILALGLLIDDYVNWKEGNASVIGDLVEQFPWLIEVIRTVEDAVRSLIDFWLAQWALLAPELGALGAALWNLGTTLADMLWPIVKFVFGTFTVLLAAVLPYVAQLASFLATMLVVALIMVTNAATGMANTFEGIFSMILGGVARVVGAFDAAKAKVAGFLDGVSGAVGKVGELLGLTNGSTTLAMAGGPSGGPSASAQAASANNSLNAPGGIIGTAGSSTSSQSTVTQSTQITGTTIQVSSPDPAKAGEAVVQALERMNKQATRNGQSAVAL